MREAFESFYEDISGHKPYWWPETEDYSPKLASIAWEAWQAALQHDGQKGERHDWQVVHNGVWESVYKCDKCGKTVTENTDGQDKPIFGCAAPQPAVPEVDEVVFDMLKAAQGACKLGLKGYANTYIQNAIDLLSAGKEKTE